MPADNAADTSSDDLTATISALASSEAQHAAVDQVVDELLAEVAAPFQPVQSSMPADIGGVVSPIVNLPANSVLPQHAAVDQVLDEVSAPLQPVQSSMPADIVSDDLAAMVVALVSSQVQHAAVDQVVDDLLDEVSAPVQSVPSSVPADTTGRVSPMVSPRVSLLANSFGPQQAGSLPAVTAPDSCYISSTTHSQPLPPATADKRSSAELSPAVPSSSIISGKENMPVVEARHVGKEVKRVVGAMGRGRGRVCCLDRSTFQEMAQALPTEPSSQVLQLTMVPSH